MKSFAVSIVLVCLMAVGILLNCSYINNVGEKIEAAANQLPDPTSPQCLDLAKALESEWEDQSKWVHISVNHTIVDRIGEQIATLVACAECGDLHSFYTARALLLDAVGDMKRLERITAVL